MKKRIIYMVIAALCSIQLTGCDELFNKDKTVNELDDSNITSIVQNVTLGSTFEQDDGNYNYLFYEELMSDSEENACTGKMEKNVLPVYIPNGDYTSINRDTAYADYLGVDFRISLNPCIQYNQDDYLISENLECFLNEEYDPFYSTDYENLRVSKIEASESDAKAWVSYCYYDKWDKVYYPMYAAYYLKQLNNDLTVLVEVKVDAENITGKTDALLKEIEDFYGFRINWDRDSEEKMLENFLVKKDTTNKLFSTGYLLFELPRDWGEDYNYSDYDVQTFALNEDAASSPCAISISREYLGSDCFSVTDICKDEKTKEKYLDEFKQVMGDMAINISLSEGGLTCMGEALLINFETEKDDNHIIVKWYMITDGDYIYNIKSISNKDCDIDIDSITENILINSILKE